MKLHTWQYRYKLPEDDVIELGEEDADALEKQQDGDYETIVIQQLVIPGQRETYVSL